MCSSSPRHTWLNTRFHYWELSVYKFHKCLKMVALCRPLIDGRRWQGIYSSYKCHFFHLKKKHQVLALRNLTGFGSQKLNGKDIKPGKVWTFSWRLRENITDLKQWAAILVCNTLVITASEAVHVHHGQVDKGNSAHLNNFHLYLLFNSIPQSIL